MNLVATEPIRVYADTSVYGGVFDNKFASPSRAFFDRVEQDRFQLVVSALVADELSKAPPHVREWFSQFRPDADDAPITPQAVALREAYLQAEIVTPKSMNDALHVALATVSECAIIVSWNFRHIVHFRKVPLYNAVNVLHHYAAIDIRSPQEVIEDED